MLRCFIIILVICLKLVACAQNNIILEASNYLNEDVNELVLVSIKNQKLYYINENEIINTFIISSSKYGIGNKQGSNKTPIGLHTIKEKHGKNVPINGKMIGRIFYGKLARIYKDLTISKEDDITSRILWLDGLEEGLNKGAGIDSYKRYIYIHGTSEEGRLGTPNSHGCIRMKNKDIIDLYKRVEVGTLVLIL